jgi:YgiT-type zinc finger domain-containing protein
MKCPKCRQGELELGVTSLTYKREGSIFQVQVDGVPAEICSVCGETYLSAEVGQELFEMVDPLLEAGTKMPPRKILPTPAVGIRFPPLVLTPLKHAIAA